MGVFVTTPLFVDKGKVAAFRPSLPEFFASFSSSFRKISLIVPFGKGFPERKMAEVDLPSNVEIVSLPLTQSHTQTLYKSPKILFTLLTKVRAKLDDCGILGCVAPSFVGTVLTPLARVKGLDVFFYVRGNKIKTFTYKYSPGPRWAFYLLLARLLDSMTFFHLRSGIPAFVVGRELVKKYGEGDKIAYQVAPLISDEFLKAARNFSSTELSKDRKILFVGWLHERKGVFDLLEAFANLLQDGESAIRLSLVGNGPQEERVKKRIEKLRISEYVEVQGYLPRGEKLFQEYDTSDLLVLPSYAEGMPRVIAEAMAFELPVVASKVGGVSEMLSENENGLLITPGSVDELSQAIKKLIRRPDLMERMGNDAGRRVREYTFSSQRKNLLAKLKNHVGGK